MLFYSNGCKVNNAEHETMQNGTNLNPGIVYLNGNCPNGGNTVPKGMIILPLPGDSTKYYLFHESFVSGESGQFSIYIGKLLYSIVDMSKDDGLGAVITKNQPVILDTLFGDMHAVKHANNTDWWVLVSRSLENKYYKALLTHEGITEILEQKIGVNPDPWYSSGGQSCFSPDGTKYARYYKKDQVLLFDFDRSTGELSNFQQLYADTTEGFWGSLSFSSNSRYLYVSTQVKLWQFDMQSPDIQSSKVLIDVYDGYTYNGFSVTFFLMQLAPDCKIYMIPVNGSKVIHVINHPDEPGLACGFEQHGFELPAIVNTTIPNYPNYRLGTPYPVCDSSIQLVTSAVPVLPPVQEVRLWPNPARSEVQVELPFQLSAAGEWRLYGSLGQPVLRRALARGTTEVVISLAEVPPGLYFWELRSEGRRLGSGKLVVTE